MLKPTTSLAVASVVAVEWTASAVNVHCDVFLKLLNVTFSTAVCVAIGDNPSEQFSFGSGGLLILF